MGKHSGAPERLSEYLWLLRGDFDRIHRHRLACALAAEVLGCHPDDLVLSADTKGKPHINAPLCISLSHRGGMMLVGMAATIIGVDLEWVERDHFGVARDQFSPGEWRWLGSVQQPDAFTRLWTAKEAVLKATGQGIALGMAEPDFSPLLRTGQPFDTCECEIGYAGRTFGVHGLAVPGDRPALAASAVLLDPLVTFPCLPPCPRAAPPCAPKRGDGAL